MKKTLLFLVCPAVFLLIILLLPKLESPFHFNFKTYANTAPPAKPDSNTLKNKKILWVSSYHKGYEANDDIERGIRASLDGSGVQLRTFFMDTKRNNSRAFGEDAGRRALAVIKEYKPDLVIASDDNAQKFLVVPHLREGAIPVVFCGVNWDASQYGYPANNVTGIIEVDLAREMYELMHRHASGSRIGYLSGDVEIERYMVKIYNSRFFDNRMKSYMVSSMMEFKEKFLQAQQEMDMLYVFNYTGIHDWDPIEAEIFLSRHTRIPTGSHNGFMAPFVTFVVAKSLQEHGEWAGATALEILGGKKITDISLTGNTKAELYVNMRIAKAASIVLPVSTLRTATIINQDQAFLDPEPGTSLPGQYNGKKIFWLDSYQEDYKWSEGIGKGIREVLYESGAELFTFHMGTKRNLDKEYGKEIGQKAFAAIQEVKPDIVLASDDNAQTYVVVPYLLDSKIPVVFCGVNWEAEQYGYPTDSVTGMLEVDGVDELLHYLSLFARGNRVAMIGGDVPTEQKNQAITNDRYFQGKLVSSLVSTMEEFEGAVLEMQDKADMLIFSNYAGISDWNGDKAVAYLKGHNRLPTGSHLGFMNDYVVFTVAKVAEEQGNYAARTALRILDGTPPSSIPLAVNKLSHLTINLDMADAAEIFVPFHLLQQAEVIGASPNPSWKQ